MALIGYPERMEAATPEIIRCPPQRLTEALALVLADLALSQRREIAAGLIGEHSSIELVDKALFVALRGERICGAAWGQRQPGNTAIFWPPQLLAGEDKRTAFELTAAVLSELDHAAVEMTQVLLRVSEVDERLPSLISAGFQELTELLYLSCEAERFPAQEPKSNELDFEHYDDSQRERLMRLVERTYEATLDCTGLNGARRMEDVIDGYRRTGAFRPQNWLFVRSGGEDVGVLLLANHPEARHWELVYMGLVPAARGRRLGRQLAEHAKWLAHEAGVERIVLAVDAANKPALRMYRRCGFELWDRRRVCVRFLGEK